MSGVVRGVKETGGATKFLPTARARHAIKEDHLILIRSRLLGTANYLGECSRSLAPPTIFVNELQEAN